MSVGFCVALMADIMVGVYVPYLLYAQGYIDSRAGIPLIAGAILTMALFVRVGFFLLEFSREQRRRGGCLGVLVGDHLLPLLAVLGLFVFQDLLEMLLGASREPTTRKLVIYLLSGLLPIRVMMALQPPVKVVNVAMGIASLTVASYHFLWHP